MSADDCDATTRLILMDGVDNFREFVEAFRVYHPSAGVLEIKDYYVRYRGWDGRLPATHDLATGRRIGAAS